MMMMAMKMKIEDDVAGPDLQMLNLSLHHSQIFSPPTPDNQDSSPRKISKEHVKYFLDVQ